MFDPLSGGLQELLNQVVPFLFDLSAGLGILEVDVEGAIWWRVVVQVCVVFTAQVGRDVLRGDEFVQLVDVLGEHDFGRDDRVQPVLDDVPDGVEDPWGLVDEQVSQRLWIVSLEARDQELDWSVVHVGHGEPVQVKEDGGGGRVVFFKEQLGLLDDQQRKLLEFLFGLVGRVVQPGSHQDDRSHVYVVALDGGLLQFQVLDDTGLLLLVDGPLAAVDDVVDRVLAPVQVVAQHGDGLFCVPLPGPDELQKGGIRGLVLDIVPELLHGRFRVQVGQRLVYLALFVEAGRLSSFATVLCLVGGVQLAEPRRFLLLGGRVVDRVTTVDGRAVHGHLPEMEEMSPNLLEHNLLVVGQLVIEGHGVCMCMCMCVYVCECFVCGRTQVPSL